MVRTFLNLASLDRAFSTYVDRGRDLSRPLNLLADAHAASVDREFTHARGVLVTGEVIPWKESHPFGSYSPVATLQHSGKLRRSWKRGDPNNITIITPRRVERGSRLPYATHVRGGSGQFLDPSPLVVTTRKPAETRRPYLLSDPRHWAQWWFLLLTYGVALSPDVFFQLTTQRRPHGTWHPNLRRYGFGLVATYIANGTLTRWQQSEISG